MYFLWHVYTDKRMDLKLSEEKHIATASDTLLMQIATDPNELAEEGTDYSILGIIKEEDYRTWIYWALRGELFNSRFSKALHRQGLKHTIAIGGRGRVDTLKAASVALGGQVHTEADIVKPNWVVRNIIDKNWEERQREQLGLPKTTE